MPTPEEVRAAINAYVKAFDAQDKAAFLDVFTDDARQIDPAPGPANVGKEAIGAFWDNAAQMAESFKFNVHNIIVCGDEAAMIFTMTLGLADKSRVKFDGVDIFKVAESGKVESITAYWDPTQIVPAD
ncbi:MAG: nuclear transport factor 2 family protein [Acidimicrobiales bacterium]